MPDSQIRLLTESDTADWLALEQEAFDDACSEAQLKAFLAGKRYLAYGLLEGEVLVAYAVYSVILDEAELIKIAVRKTHRGQRIADQLMVTLNDELHGQGVLKVMLEVRESNRTAIALYQRLGFSLDGQRKDYYPLLHGREDALLMSLGLQ